MLIDDDVDLYISKIWKKCMICHCFSFCISFNTNDMISDFISLTQMKRISVSFHAFKLQMYKKWKKNLMWNIIVRLSDDQHVWNIIKYHQITLLISWLWFEHVHENVKMSSTRKLMIDVYTEKILKWWIRKCMKIENAHIKTSNESAQSEDWHKISEKYNDYMSQKILVWLLKRASKLCVMLSIIQDKVLFYKKKSVVWCNNSEQQEQVESALYTANINVRIFHVRLNHNECQKLIKKFIIKFNECMILICLYYVNSVDINLQRLCYNVHLYDILISDIIIMQAVSQIHQLKQRQIVKIYKYVILDIFNI